MIRCPICSNLVSEFKPNCHVLPRWALNLTKEDGRNFLISTEKSGLNQSDLKTQSWCQECEKEFAYLDSVGAVFFRDNDKLLATDKSELNIYRFHDIETYHWVRRFISSIVVRYYLYLLNDRRVYIGESIYNDIFKAYLNDQEIHFVLHDTRKFNWTTSGCPAPAFGTIQLMINGILIVLTTDMFEKDYYRIKTGEVIVCHVTDPSSPLAKQLEQIRLRCWTPELHEKLRKKFAANV